MSNQKNEAMKIVDTIFDSYGTGGITRGEIPYFDAKSSIMAMKEAEFPGWRDVEWGSYHLKFVVNDLCNDFLNIVDFGERRLLFKGNYIWDIRYHKEGKNTVPLGDIEQYSRIIKENNGLGLLIFNIHAEDDRKRSFIEWHEALKGGPTDYVIQREQDGRREQPRKTDYCIKKVFAFYFSPDDIISKIENKWLKTSFQVGFRNSDASPRKGKYMLDTRYIPSDNLLFIKNFNEDPEEFAEDFPEYA